MKLLTISISLLALFSFNSLAQEIDTNEAQILWESNIHAILTENEELIIQHTEFPLSTYNGELTSEEFQASMSDFLTDEVIEDIRKQSSSDFQVIVNADGLIAYMLVAMTTTVTEDGEFESATILSFKKTADTWKLYRIDAAG